MKMILSQQTIEGLGTGSFQLCLGPRHDRILLVLHCAAGGPCDFYFGDTSSQQFFAQSFPLDKPVVLSYVDAPVLIQQGIIVLQHVLCPWYVTEVWSECVADPCDKGE